MQTNIVKSLAGTAAGQEAESILRKCVHCGFCNATCPTYQLTGDELDGPRGRIYLIKQMLEGNAATSKTQFHLDRCLTCRSCETTCPSGVEYGRLLEIGRNEVEANIKRPLLEKAKRAAIRQLVPYPRRFKLAMKLSHLLKPVLPASLQKKILPKQQASSWPQNNHNKRMLMLDGCVQPSMAPNINAAAASVLDSLGVSLINVEQVGCCGAIDIHLGAPESGLAQVKRNINAWWPEVENSVVGLVVTASGCGATVKEYGHLLRNDSEYAGKAKRISELAMDSIEAVEFCLHHQSEKSLTDLRNTKYQKVAFHSPCTLQHGQQIKGRVERVLVNAGFELTQVADAHLCCGSAGTYSLLQPEMSQKILGNKLNALQAGKPDVIATANIGCYSHMLPSAEVPVVHWLELFV